MTNILRELHTLLQGIQADVHATKGHVTTNRTAVEIQPALTTALTLAEGLTQLQPITVYIMGDEDGPDMFGLIYDREDEAMECAVENSLTLWKLPVLPLPDQATKVESDSGE